MARPSFKQGMIDLTGGAYNYYERGMYVLLSGITLGLKMYLYQPINIVMYDLGTHPALLWSLAGLQVFLAYFYVQTFID